MSTLKPAPFLHVADPMRPTIIALLVLATILLPAANAVADHDDDPTHVDECHRFLFLHWVDYSHHFLCVNTAPEPGDCHVSYKRWAPDGNSETCIL